MGVHGLWKLIEETKENTLLTTLASKIVAIDSSIWLYQFLKTRPDVSSAPLVGFLSRIIKLEMHGVKCIFVFDGVAPTLKKRILSERKRKRGQGKELEAETELQVFQKRLQLHALESLKNPSEIHPQEKKEIVVPPEQTFYIPTADPRFATESELKEFVEAHAQNAKHIDVILQHSQILDQKLQSRRPLNHGHLYQIAQDPLEFSKFQIENLKKRNEMTHKYTEFTRTANLVENPKSNVRVEAGKLSGERNASYVLLKKVDKPGYEMRLEVLIHSFQDNNVPKSKDGEKIFASEQDILDHVDELFAHDKCSDQNENEDIAMELNRKRSREEPEESIEDIMKKFDAIERAEAIRESKRSRVEPTKTEQKQFKSNEELDENRVDPLVIKAIEHAGTSPATSNHPEKSIEQIMFEFACLQPSSSKLPFLSPVQIIPSAQVQKSRQLLLEFWTKESGRADEIAQAFDCEIVDLKEKLAKFVKRVDKMPETIERMGDLNISLFWRGCLDSILAFREGREILKPSALQEEEELIDFLASDFDDYETEDEESEAFWKMQRERFGRLHIN